MKPGLTVLLAWAATGSLRGEGVGTFHFEHDIAPYLARAGCAAADCHGGATGRGGFKLSLFATNARADYEAITQELEGRRIDFADPHQSLLLRKPTKRMKHGGGKVVSTDSGTIRALETWIKAGAPFARGDAGVLSSLKLKREDDRVVVTAGFEGTNGDGQQRDVTSLSRFESTDDRVVSIDQHGQLTLRGPGETWILAHYGPLSARLPIRKPFGVIGDPPDTAHALDDAWHSRLAQLGLQPAQPVEDHTLLRRLYLDLCGRPPAPHEVGTFRSRSPATSITTTVAEILQSEEFSDQLTRHLWRWFEIPAVAGDLHYTKDRNARLRAATREFAASDNSLLDFAAELFANPGRREFVNRFGDPRDRAEFTGRALLGISIGCARCHNHPMDRWSQAQHLQFSACFTDHRPATGQGKMMAPGKFFLPGDGKAVQPALLPIALKESVPARSDDRAAQLARFLREEAADALARNAANRIFGFLIGRHLVETPDDHRLSNPAIHEPLMELLATEFKGGQFRIRPLVQLIATSQLYATASDPTRPDTLSGDPELQYLARREARPMSGDEYLRSVAFVLGIDPPPAGVPETPLARQLQLLNSGTLQEWLRVPGNQVEALFAFENESDELLDQLYLLILSRPPRPAERAEFLPLLSEARDQLAVGRDLAFALLASREFSSIR